MMALALAALLSVQDPVGDTVGNGSLVAPTAAVFRLDSFDLTSAEVLDTATLTLAMSFAALPNPLELPNGFSLPIIEIYVGDETSGSTDLLPGSGMGLPDGASWHYAFRLTGDHVQAFVADNGAVTELVADGLELTVLDNVITLQTPLPRLERPVLYGVVGAYSPFSDSGWQALSAVPAPWTFSSSDQTVPVVDVLAADADAQTRAVDTQTLPALSRPAPPQAPRENRWLLLVAGGVIVALVGIVGRFTVPKPALRTGLPPEVYEQAKGTPATAHANEPVPAVAREPEPDDTELADTTLINTENTDTQPEATPATLDDGLEASDPENADLEAWTASETGKPAPDKEPIPVLPETYPPGTGPARAQATPREDADLEQAVPEHAALEHPALEHAAFDPKAFSPEDWLEPDEDADLWTRDKGAETVRKTTHPPVGDADVKHS